jgi:hypothetical protein
VIPQKNGCVPVQSVSKLRDALRKVPGALIDLPPGRCAEGDDRVQEIWLPDSYAETSTLNPLAESAVPDGEHFSPVLTLAPEIEGGIPKLGRNGAAKLASETELLGVDALGYYVPFHCTGRQWGIHVKLSGLAYLAGAVFGQLRASDDVKLQMAFQTIVDHELFHFATEYAIGQLDYFFQGPIWRNRVSSVRDGDPPYLEREEELANAYMLLRGRSSANRLRCAGKQEVMRRFTMRQGPGYRDGWKVRQEDWPSKLKGLIADYATSYFEEIGKEHLIDENGVYDWTTHFPIHPVIDWRYCPVFLVDDSRRYGLPPGWLRAFSRLTLIDETVSFLKQLARLSTDVQRAWVRIKRQLAQAVTPGRDFKRWLPGGPDVYSLRVNDGIRAHLRHESQADRWVAIEIGGHKQLGHG